MSYDPSRHHRRSIRLPGYDYTQPGAYFVTLCLHHRRCLFGEVEEDIVRLSPAGQMVESWWHCLPSEFPRAHLDAFVVMPNHVHGIIGLVDTATDPNGKPGPDVVGAPLVGALPEAEPPRLRAGTRPAPTRDQQETVSLGDIVGAFKSLTTNAYIRGVRTRGWPPFDGRLWQRNYWERVLSDERELDLARRYIRDNPLRRHLDRMHPERKS